jgi:HEAT repeat protein
MDVLRLYPLRESLGQWVRILKETESFVLKTEVMEYIADANDRSVVMPLAKELESPFYTVRRSAARILARVGDDRIYPLILSMLKSENPVRRIHGIEALFYLYDVRFYPGLMELLNDKNKSVRIYSLRCLRENSVDKSLNAVRKMAESDSDSEVRLAAIAFLGDFNDRQSVYLLLKTISDRDREVRLASAASLYRMNSLMSALTLCQRLGEENDDEILDLIMDALVKLRSVPNFYGVRKILLGGGNVRLRIKAACTMSHVRDEQAVPALVQALKDADYRVRAESCASLGNFRSPQALESLVGVVREKGSRYVWSAALYAILNRNTRDATVRLFDVYSVEEDPIFRSQLYSVIRKLIVRYH